MLHFIEDQVEWTKEKYSLTSFKEKGHFKLPTLIHITSGYFGKDDSDTFSSDDILVLYEWKMQERVLARKGKVSISIPLDFEHKLEVIGQGQPGKLMHMSQIVQKYKPPVQVRFGPNTNVFFTLGLQEVQAEAFGAFTLISSHFLEYVTASTTVNGKISTEELVCLPIYRMIRFVVATRLHGIPMEQQRHYFHSFLDHMETTTTLGILEYTELLDTEEEYDYLRSIPSGTWGKPRDDRVHTNNNGRYTLLKKVDPVNSKPVETDQTAKNKVTSPGPGPGKYAPIKRRGSKRPHLPIELPVRMPRDDIYIPTDIPTSPENDPESPFAFPKQSPIFHAVSPRTTSLMVIPTPGRQRPVASVCPRPLSPSIRDPSKTDQTRTGVPLASSLFHGSSARPKVPPVVSPRPLNPLPNPSSPSRASQHTATGSGVTSSTPNLSHARQSPPVSSFPMPIHEERLHTIADSTPALFPSGETSQITGSVVPPPLVIHTLEDVPADLTSLSVDQVCQCLALLNLGEFAPSFRHALIDGRILSGCSLGDLKQEFSMGHLSARKLAMFANDGWRPKE